MKALRKTEDTTFNRVWSSIFTEDEIQLTAAENTIAERWDYAWKIMSGVATNGQVINALRKKFGISKRQAHNDLRSAIDLYAADPREVTKKQKHAIAEEWIIRGLKLAKKNGDMDNFTRLLARFTKINGLENFTEAPKPREAQIIVFSDNPEILKKRADELMEDIEDIGHEEV